MSREACMTVEEIFEAVKDIDCFTNSTAILKFRCNPVWIDIRRFLKNKI